jgi:uncharacterized alpha-E superfamily protein
MLTRLAENCFWLGRYMERADHVARVVAATQDLALDPEPGPSAFTAACAATGSTAPPEGVDGATWLVCGDGNAASLAACLRAARENARAARPLIGDDLWECANAAWLHVQPLDGNLLADRGVAETCSWALGEVRRLHGTVDELMQDESAAIIRIGAGIEHIDAVCRLVAAALVDGGLEARPANGTTAFRRWRALADSAGVIHHLRLRGIVAGDLDGTCRLIVSEAQCPLSLAAAVASLRTAMTQLGGPEAGTMAERIHIPEAGAGPLLHAGLMSAITAANRLSSELQSAGFLVASDPPGGAQSQSQTQGPPA